MPSKNWERANRDDRVAGRYRIGSDEPNKACIICSYPTKNGAYKCRVCASSAEQSDSPRNNGSTPKSCATAGCSKTTKLGKRFCYLHE